MPSRTFTRRLVDQMIWANVSSIDNTYHITDDPVVTLNAGKNSFQNVCINFFQLIVFEYEGC